MEGGRENTFKGGLLGVVQVSGCTKAEVVKWDVPQMMLDFTSHHPNGYREGTMLATPALRTSGNSKHKLWLIPSFLGVQKSAEHLYFCVYML